MEFFLLQLYIIEREIAQLGRAPGLGPGGRKFESCHLDFLLENFKHVFKP